MAESTALLREALTPYRARSYADLQRLMEESQLHEVTGASGARYAIKVHAFWDDRPFGNLRVSGAIDDGGWRAFAPLCDDFIIAPDGSFVDADGTAARAARDGWERTKRLFRFALGGGVTGLGLWCAQDWLHVKSPATRVPDGLELMFPIALAPVALFHFRGEPLPRRALLSLVGVLAACVVALGLVIGPGTWFHLWIGGRL